MNKIKKPINPASFLDLGYPPGYSFCEKFLSSGEFTISFLNEFDVFRGSELKTKAGHAINVARALDNKTLDSHEFLLEYVKKPRTWLTLKTGTYAKLPKLSSPEELLFSFCEPSWYGPIKQKSNPRTWYIRTYKIPHRIPVQSSDSTDNGNSNPEERETFQLVPIRWTIIAEVTEKYLALTWDGFSYTEEYNANSRSQFPFWLSIPEAFKELENHLGGKWEYPQLHTLLLHTLWDKFIENSEYQWSHKRIRAHSSGIALNAHSSSDTEVDVDEKGLKALSKKLSEAALDALEYSYPHDQKAFSQVEASILNALIREWGTKSYEFTLKKIKSADLGTEAIGENGVLENEESKNKFFFETIFRVHCYFGLDELAKSQDSLPHLKCYGECNFSKGALDFLLSELGIEETGWLNSLVNPT
jgi:hypothetical protein